MSCTLKNRTFMYFMSKYLNQMDAMCRDFRFKYLKILLSLLKALASQPLLK